MNDSEFFVDRHDQLWLLPWENPMRARFDAAFYRGIPNTPGVYIMLNEAGQVIYVGKSCRLRDRLKQYRAASPRTDSRKVLRLVTELRDIRYEPCRSDDEACMRENFLLRNFRPKYNVMNTKPFTYFFITVVEDEEAGEVRWQLTLSPSYDDHARIFGAFKGRRAAKKAYQALVRLQWVFCREARSLAELPHELVIDKAPRDFRMGTSARFRAEVLPLIVAFMRGESADALDWFEEELHAAGCPEMPDGTMEPFLVGWMLREIETLRKFYERTLQEHKIIRDGLPLAPDIIPQEKVDDLLLLHKNARPESATNITETNG